MFQNDKEITDQIRKLIPINELTDKIQNKLIANADLIELKKGKYLFKKGDRDHFSFYLLTGEIDLVSDRTVHDTISGGSERARYAMAQLQPRQFSALAKTPIQVLKVNRTVLDKLLMISKETGGTKVDLSDTISGPGQMEVSEIDEQENMDWMTRMLQSDLFSKIPSGNIQTLFTVLDSREYKAGDTIIEQGQDGENYYVIQEGKCLVTRKAGASSAPIKLAELKTGDSFGEESLLMDTKCNATVTMATDGILMRLSKDSFIDLIKKPTVQSISYGEAQELINTGAKWIDVRFDSEYKESHILGSQNIPLNLLRTQVKKLEQNLTYIMYCDTGGRSSTAAFLMTERGYKAYYLEGGLISNHDIEGLQKSQLDEPQLEEPQEAAPEPKLSLEEPSIEPSAELVSGANTESDADMPVATQVSEAELETAAEESVVEETELNNADSQRKAMRQLKKLKREFEQEMLKEKEAIRLKYAEAQKMLESAKQIKQDAEETKQKLEQDINHQSSVVELSQQKQQKEQQERIEKLEAEKLELVEDNKKLEKKKSEMEGQIMSAAKDMKALKTDKKDLEKQLVTLQEQLDEAISDKEIIETETSRIRQQAKRIIEEYQKKHKQLFDMEEEKILSQLNTLDERNSSMTVEKLSQHRKPTKGNLEVASSDDKNLKEMKRIKRKQQNMEDDLDENDKTKDDLAAKLMDEITSQLGTGKS